VGEFEHIAKIRRLAEKTTLPGESVRLGIGDDCCLVAAGSDQEFALSTDTIVEGVHFRLDYFSYYQVGVKAAAAAISDLAAMAAEPVGSLAAVSISESAAESALEDLASGLIDTCEKYGCPLLGGDLTRSPSPLVATVTVIGKLPAGTAIRRSTARPGDEIWVTGSPGDAAAVLAVLENARGGCGPRPQVTEEQAARLHEPVPRLAEARLLRNYGLATAMIDISDGVAADLNHILESSGCGALLFGDRLPVSEFSRSVAGNLALRPEHFLLYGGEDFELLFTSGQQAVQKHLAGLRKKSHTSFTLIGRITDKIGELAIIRENGRLEQVEKTGFDHFKKPETTNRKESS